MSYKVGIDFGTCFSFIAYCTENDGKPGIHILINPVDRMPYEIPSVYFHGEKEKMRDLCGFEAIDHADSLRGSEDEAAYVVRHVKQQLSGPNDAWGSAPADTSAAQNFELKGGTKSPKEIVASFFRYFAALARESLHAEDHNELERQPNGESIEAVIAVPVIFGEEERSVIIEAAQDAGITVIGLIEEPVAIAIDYIEHLNKKDELEPVLVYDLGGGTVDVACIKYHPDTAHEIELRGGTKVRIPTEKTYEVIVSTGRRIGGVKWDEILSEYILSRCEEEYKSPPIDDQARPFHRRVTETKHILSKKDEINMPFTYIDATNPIPQNRDVLITRNTFEDKTAALLSETLDCVRHISSRCGLKNGTKIRVVLSGGSSRMPQVREGVLRILEEEMGVTVVNRKSMLYRHEKAVALGATRYAQNLSPAQTTSMYGVALRDKRGQLSNETFLIDRGQALPVSPVEWTIPTPAETLSDATGEAEIVVLESYEKVPYYLNQTDRLISIPVKLESASPIKGTLSMQEGGVLKLTVTHPETSGIETRFFSINTFPHPRRLKMKR
ncbi:MAG: Hsp70 family protein [Defluviitaleaceae bacterium]|nr:Hsp70 family protein [Defluviitaleaceae bacterium]